MPKPMRFRLFLVLSTLLCLGEGSPTRFRPAGPAFASEPEVKKGKGLGDESDIARLIAQLGSTDFAEREGASVALEKIGFPALDQLRLAAKGNDAERAGRAAHLVGIIENGFDQLLADYRTYGLPLPPEGARLVRFESGGRYIYIDKMVPPTYFFGFQLEVGTDEKPALLLVGTREIHLEASKIVEVAEPKPDLVKGLDLQWWGPSPFEMNAGLAIALQFKARGYHDLAKELWTVSIKRHSGHPFGTFYQPSNLRYRTAVSYLAWAHYGNELVKPGTDRSKLAKQIKALLEAEAALNTEANRELLKSLEASLVPSTAKPGSVESMVDDLIEMSNVGRSRDEPDPRFSRLEHLGFAAVPALIDHLDDDRLTRSIKQGFNNFPTWNVRVKHVVSDLLQEIAGEDVGKDWLQRQKGWGVKKADAQAWWEKASNVGQEAYYVEHVLPAGNKQGWPNTLMLETIAEKYPQHLGKVYRLILDERPNIQSWPVAEAISKSSLTVEQKKELFLHAAANKDWSTVGMALSNSRTIDPEQFVKLLVTTLEMLPRSPTRPYWECPEAGLVHLVLQTDDRQAWEMLEKVAKRSDVGLRMEFMKWMGNPQLEDRHRQLRMAFLSAFLSDTEARDPKAKPDMFEGPHASSGFARLEVRDLAAMTIATILGMSEQPDRSWSAEQWQELRKKISKSIQK